MAIALGDCMADDRRTNSSGTEAWNPESAYEGRVNSPDPNAAGTNTGVTGPTTGGTADAGERAQRDNGAVEDERAREGGGAATQRD